MFIFDATAAINTLAPIGPSIPTSAGVAILFGYAQDYLKRLNSIPKINYYSSRFNTRLRVVLSGIGTLGVSYAWSKAGANHQLLVTIPPAAVLISGFFHWTINFGIQHGFEIQLAQRPVAKAAQLAQANYKPPDLPVAVGK